MSSSPGPGSAGAAAESLAAPPIRLGDARHFAALRAGLLEAGYDTAGVCARTGADSVYTFRSVHEGREPLDPSADALALLIHLFMDGQVTERSLLERLLSAPVTRAMEALGLLRDVAEQPGRCLATVLLYPTESLHIVSDRDYDPTSADPRRPVLTADSVYPAITTNTGDFLSTLPDSPCERLLDLCSGTGIAALLQAPLAQHAWAVDVTARSTFYARFNAALNGVANVTALEGDVYEPVAGELFDRIVAHPPYMPALQQTYIYRDAGADGEQVTRRVIEGLPAHLAEGGTFHCSCMATDRRGAPLQQRVRQMLGESARDFDVVVATTGASDPREYYANELSLGRMGAEESMAHVRALAALGVERLVVSVIMIRRHGEARDGVVVRRQRGPASRFRELDWLLQWQTAAASPGMEERLVDAHPRLSPEVRLHVVSSPGAAGWEARDFMLEADWPFSSTTESNGQVSAFLARCDGRRSMAELLDELKRAGALADSMTVAEFAGVLKPLIAAGYIEMEAFPLPPAPSGAIHSNVKDADHA